MGKIGNIPLNIDNAVRNVLIAMKKEIERVALPDTAAPTTPTNVTVTPQPLANQINFTAGRNASKHLILISPTPNWNPTKLGNVVVDVGEGTHFTHHVGQGGITYYYWVVAKRGNDKSQPTAPVSGTTLAFNAAGSQPTVYIPPSQDITPSKQTGKPTIVEPRVGGGHGGILE